MKGGSDKKLYLLIITVFLIWGLSIPLLFRFFASMDERAKFGDMFGAVNALFSALALAGVIYTIFLQKKELTLQREELRYTREELKRSATAQEKSEKALQKQVESMEKAAKLNGLSSILGSHGSLMVSTMTGKYPDVTSYTKTKQDAAKIISQIEKLIE